VRNFSAMCVHANNLFHRDVRVFAGATVFVDGAAAVDDRGSSAVDPGPSPGTEQGSSPAPSALAAAAVRYVYRRDSVSQSARSVCVPLRHLVASALTVRLEFDARWILISEIRFDSGE